MLDTAAWKLTDRSTCHPLPDLRGEAMSSMTFEQWEQSGKAYSHREHRIFYRDAGDGLPLVCIHGFPTASWDWHRVWEPLQQRFRVVAADMIGFGFSDKPTGYTYSIHDQADLHEGLLRSLGIEEAHILAHDYGDSVAQEMLARFQERSQEGRTGLDIRSICFLNGGLFPESHRARPIQKLLRLPILGALISRSMNEDAFLKTFPTIFGPKTKPSLPELHEFWLLMARSNGHLIGHKLIRYIDDRRKHRDRWVGAMQSTNVPLRFIDGPEDPVSGRHMAERYLELIPGGDVVLLEGIGHYPQVEDPEGVLQAFGEFQESSRARGGN
jgi:pimeloyl-ACP methyl ester carboxylesterase